MTAKEKASELTNKFYCKTDSIGLLFCLNYSNAKQCAFIAVDEIINAEPRYPSNVDWDDCGATHQYYYEAQMEEALKYWQQVKTEIEKL